MKLNVRLYFRGRRVSWARTVNKCETLDQAMSFACAWKPHRAWIERAGEPATKLGIKVDS